MRGSHLFQLLRPEFCQSYSKPLCNDAFTGFITGLTDKEYNNDIIEATNMLRSHVIPNFVINNLVPKFSEIQRHFGGNYNFKIISFWIKVISRQKISILSHLCLTILILLVWFTLQESTADIW